MLKTLCNAISTWEYMGGGYGNFRCIFWGRSFRVHCLSSLAKRLVCVHYSEYSLTTIMLSVSLKVLLGN